MINEILQSINQKNRLYKILMHSDIDNTGERMNINSIVSLTALVHVHVRVYITCAGLYVCCLLYGL